MDISRREFLGKSAGAVSVLGFYLIDSRGFGRPALAAKPAAVAEVPVIWVATGSCTGCSVSLLNSAAPSIQELLLGQVLPGKHLSLGFHSTIMAASGETAVRAMDAVVRQSGGKYVLVVDGATATKEDGRYCSIGESSDGKALWASESVRELGRNAAAVLSVGTCAAFGGIPAAEPNPTGCASVLELLEKEGILTPVVNIPGCPPHPDWIVGTIATILIGGLSALELDEHRRPKAFYGPLIHDNCPYRGHFDRGEFAERFGWHGCLLKLGCKGPMTHADCPLRKWNGGANWCVAAGHPCIGCCEPAFPFSGSLYRPVEPSQLTFPASYPPAGRLGPKAADVGTYVTVGLVGVGGFLAGAGVALAARKLMAQATDEEAPPPSARKE